MRIGGLLALFVFLMILQAMFLIEAFGSSQGGAQLQLATSRPIYYVTEVPVAKHPGLYSYIN
jgi:hypothetical protein